MFLNFSKDEAEEEEERIEEEKGHQASSLSQKEQANPESEEVEGDQEGETVREQTSREQENNQAAEAPPLCSVHDLGHKDTGPKQVKQKSYPHESFGTQKRAFHSSWFVNHTWLEYSVDLNAAFCFPCRLFGKNIKHDALGSSGCHNWKNALSIFSKHAMAQSHKESIIAWQNYKLTSQVGDVAQMMLTGNARDISDKRLSKANSGSHLYVR